MKMNYKGQYYITSKVMKHCVKQKNQIDVKKKNQRNTIEIYHLYSLLRFCNVEKWITPQNQKNIERSKIIRSRAIHYFLYTIYFYHRGCMHEPTHHRWSMWHRLCLNGRFETFEPENIKIAISASVENLTVSFKIIKLNWSNRKSAIFSRPMWSDAKSWIW